MLRRDFCLLCASVLLVPAVLSGESHAQEAMNPRLPTLYLVGNAEMTGQTGWNTSVRSYFDPAKINVTVRPMGIRAAMDGSAWDTVLAGMKSGDIVLLQFGAETPSATGTTLEALPGIGDDTKVTGDPASKTAYRLHSYGWYLRKFVIDTIAHGASPILCSPAPRNAWNSGKIERSEATYGGWARAIAVQQKVPFVDAGSILAGRFDAAGQSTAGMFYGAEGQASAPGSAIAAEAVVSGLLGLPHDPLAGYFSAKGQAVPPTAPPASAPTPGSPVLR